MRPHTCVLDFCGSRLGIVVQPFVGRQHGSGFGVLPLLSQHAKQTVVGATKIGVATHGLSIPALRVGESILVVATVAGEEGRVGIPRVRVRDVFEVGQCLGQHAPIEQQHGDAVVRPQITRVTLDCLKHDLKCAIQVFRVLATSIEEGRCHD